MRFVLVLVTTEYKGKPHCRLRFTLLLV